MNRILKGLCVLVMLSGMLLGFAACSSAPISVNITNDGAHEAYQSILEEYLAVCADPTMVNENHYGADKGRFDTEFPHVSATIIHYYLSNETDPQFNRTLYYTYWDIDGNGIDELLIGDQRTSDYQGYARICDIYSFNGREAVKLFDGDHYFEDLGYRVSVDVFTDGVIYAAATEGRDTPEDPLKTSFHFYHLAENGYELQEDTVVFYDPSTDPRDPYILGSEHMQHSGLQALYEQHEQKFFTWDILVTPDF